MRPTATRRVVSDFDTTSDPRNSRSAAATFRWSAAISSNWCLTSSAAARMAGDSVGTVLLPPLGVANCVVAVSACSIEMRSMATLSSSATSCAPHVLVPHPMSLAPMFRWALPSENSLTMTVAGGPPAPPCHMPPATPTPRFTWPGRAALARASFQPKALAPSSRHRAKPVVV